MSGTHTSPASATQGGRPKALLSTHVLDVAQGCPASGVRISYFRKEQGDWKLIRDGIETDADGRCEIIPADGDFKTADYKLQFDLNSYYNRKNVQSMFSVITVTFVVKEPRVDSLHVPLLVSPYGYTTYRGS